MVAYPDFNSNSRRSCCAGLDKERNVCVDVPWTLMVCGTIDSHYGGDCHTLPHCPKIWFCIQMALKVNFNGLIAYKVNAKTPTNAGSQTKAKMHPCFSKMILKKMTEKFMQFFQLYDPTSWMNRQEDKEKLIERTWVPGEFSKSKFHLNEVLKSDFRIFKVKKTICQSSTNILTCFQWIHKLSTNFKHTESPLSLTVLVAFQWSVICIFRFLCLYLETKKFKMCCCSNREKLNFNLFQALPTVQWSISVLEETQTAQKVQQSNLYERSKV